jgi:hypothetical protein
MRSICRHEGQNGRSKALVEDKSRNRRRALRRSAVTAALALALSGCASVDRMRDASGDVAIGGFTYAAPGPRWRGMLYPPSKSGLLFHHYRFDGGGPAQPWATIEERGLFCIDPTGPARLLQVRVFERLVPDGEASVNFEQRAAQLLARVRARRDTP